MRLRDVHFLSPSLINASMFRDFVLGTAVALVVVSSSAQVSPTFEDFLRTTVLGERL